MSIYLIIFDSWARARDISRISPRQMGHIVMLDTKGYELEAGAWHDSETPDSADRDKSRFEREVDDIQRSSLASAPRSLQSRENPAFLGNSH